VKGAQKLPNGSMIVLVHDLKTTLQGASRLSFFWNGLYEANIRYVEVFKPNWKDEDFVFGTSSGKAHNIRKSMV